MPFPVFAQPHPVPLRGPGAEGGALRGLPAQVPVHPVDAGAAGPGERPQHLAVLPDDLDLRRLLRGGGRRDPVGDPGAVGRVLPGHQTAGLGLHLLFREEAPGRERVEHPERRLGRSGGAGRLGQGPQRPQIVEDEEPASVGGDGQVVEPLLDHHAVDRRRGQVPPQREPGIPVVHAGPDLVVGPGEEQPGLLRMLPDHMDEGERGGGDAAADLLPGLAQVRRPEQVRAEVAVLVAAHREVGGPGIVVARLDELDPTLHIEPGFFQTFGFERHGGAPVHPGGAAVRGQVEPPVHAPGPELPRSDRRFRQGEEHRAVEGVEVVHGDPAGVLLARLVVRGQVRADRLPGLAPVVGLVDELAADPGGPGPVAGEDHREVPVPADREVGRRPAVAGLRPDPDVPGVAGAVVVHLEAAVVAAGPDEVVVRRFRGGPAALAAADPLPGGERDAAPGGAAGAPVGVAVLAVPVHPVGDPVVHGQVVHLRHREHHPPPTGAPVQREAAAAVVGHQDAVRVLGVHPDIVVVAAGPVRGLHQRAAAVHRGREEHRGEVEAVGVCRVHREADIVGSALGQVVVGEHQPPGVAGVVGTVEAGALVLEERVPAVGVARGDLRGDLAHRMVFPAGEAAAAVGTGEAFPGVAPVERPVEAAAGAAAPQAVGVDPQLPHPGQQPVGVAAVEGQVGAAGVVVHGEHLLPVGAAVGRAVHAALRLRGVGVAQGAGVHPVRVGGMDQNAGDAAGGFEPPVVERAAPVGGAVDAVPHGERRADDEGLAGPGPDLGRVAGGDREGADRGGLLVVEDRLPGDPAVAGAPETPGSGAEESEVRVAGDADGGAEPVPVGADMAPLQGVEQVRVGGFPGGVGLRRGARCRGDGRCRGAGRCRGDGRCRGGGRCRGDGRCRGGGRCREGARLRAGEQGRRTE